jgi:NodT family efflux transporter outer membrane factor (OMF) lipoprotein
MPIKLSNLPVVSLAALGTLSGCMIGPNYKAPEVKVNPSFAESQVPTTGPATTQLSKVAIAASPPVEWWSTFRDSELQSLVQRAVKENLDLKQAASRVRQARAQAGVTGADLLPNFNMDGGYQRAHGSKNVSIPLAAFGASGGSSGSSNSTASTPKSKLTLPGQVNTAQTNSGQINEAANPGGPQSPLGLGGLPGVSTSLYQVGFDSNWEIDVFGGSRRAVQAAINDVQAAEEDRRDVLVTLLAEVARTYVNLRGYQKQMQIAKENLAAQQDTLELTTAKFKAGFVTDLDVARQATQVATTAADLPVLDAQIRISIHAMGVLLAEDPNALMTELSANGPIPPVPPEIPIGLPSELLRRRPDVRRAERQLAAATARIGEAEADLLPKFSITAALGFDSTRPKALFDWSSRYWAVSPGVSWPIFDAGRICFNITVKDEQQKQASEAYQLAVLTALKDVEDSLSSYRTEQLRNAALVDASTAAHQAVVLAKQQYEQGIVDFLTVLDAERAEFGTEDSVAQSDRNISTDLIALYKALGGGWEVMLPLPQND